jgi:hypothetical protein
MVESLALFAVRIDWQTARLEVVSSQCDSNDSSDSIGAGTIGSQTCLLPFIGFQPLLVFTVLLIRFEQIWLSCRVAAWRHATLVVLRTIVIAIAIAAAVQLVRVGPALVVRSLRATANVRRCVAAAKLVLIVAAVARPKITFTRITHFVLLLCLFLFAFFLSLSFSSFFSPFSLGIFFFFFSATWTQIFPNKQFSPHTEIGWTVDAGAS